MRAVARVKIGLVDDNGWGCEDVVSEDGYSIMRRHWVVIVVVVVVVERLR